METIARQLGWGLVSIARRLFTGTPIQRWKLTSLIYAKLIDLMYSHKDIVAAYKGVELILPSKDPSIVPPIIRGTYESLELDVYRQLVTKTKVVLDVGANIGLYATVGAKSNPKAKIISFEPVTDNIEYLKKNIEVNQLSNVEVIEAAVGEKSGQIDMYLSDTSIGHHSAVPGGNSKITVAVPVVSVDEYVKKSGLKPDILKVDVEGYDLFVFKGATSTLESHKPTVFAEYGPAMMKRQGYEPKEFLNLLFKPTYHAFVFDEANANLTPTTKKELLIADHSQVRNLIFVSNQKHLKILIEQFS